MIAENKARLICNSNLTNCLKDYNSINSISKLTNKQIQKIIDYEIVNFGNISLKKLPLVTNHMIKIFKMTCQRKILLENASFIKSEVIVSTYIDNLNDLNDL